MPDRAWAEWIALQLEQAGYQVIIQVWDFVPGDNFMDRMKDAPERADRTLALVWPRAWPHCTDEWTGAFLHDPDSRNRLLQVRIEDCDVLRLLRAPVYIHPVRLPRKQAKAQLLAGVRRGRRKPLPSRRSRMTSARDRGFRVTAWTWPTAPWPRPA